MFSWQINVEREANISEESLWNSWKNVEQWPSWDSSLEWSRLNGPFHEGVQGVLKPKGWFASNFTVTKVCGYLLFAIYTWCIYSSNGKIK